MDITRPIAYRGLLLTGAVGGPGGAQPIEGIRLTRARFTDVSVHGYTEKKSLEDGMDASDVFIGTRRVTLAGEVFAQTKAQLFEYLDALRLLMTPTDAYAEAPAKKGYLPLSFSQPTMQTYFWPTGFVDRVIYVRPAMQPDYEIELGAISGVDTAGYSLPFTVVLEAIDPRFYAPVQAEQALSGYGGTGTLQNRGNYPAPLNFIVVMPASAAGSYTFSWVGVGSTFTIAVPAGAWQRILRLDSINKVLTLEVNGVETLRMDLVTFAGESTYPKVPPTPEGESAAGFTWSCDGPVDGAGARLWYNEAWV